MTSAKSVSPKAGHQKLSRNSRNCMNRLPRKFVTLVVRPGYLWTMGVPIEKRANLAGFA